MKNFKRLYIENSSLFNTYPYDIKKMKTAMAGFIRYPRKFKDPETNTLKLSFRANSHDIPAIQDNLSKLFDGKSPLIKELRPKAKANNFDITDSDFIEWAFSIRGTDEGQRVIKRILLVSIDKHLPGFKKLESLGLIKDLQLEYGNQLIVSYYITELGFSWVRGMEVFANDEVPF